MRLCRKLVKKATRGGDRLLRLKKRCWRVVAPHLTCHYYGNYHNTVTVIIVIKRSDDGQAGCNIGGGVRGGGCACGGRCGAQSDGRTGAHGRLVYDREALPRSVGGQAKTRGCSRRSAHRH